jgi:hypothetical protein
MRKELLANIPPFGLRMQAVLKEKIETAALDNNRSMNAEIVTRLERSFEKIGQPDRASVAEPKSGIQPLDILWGAEEIGEFIGRSARMTFHMLSNGELPGRKVGGRWCASRSKLVEFFNREGGA